MKFNDTDDRIYNKLTTDYPMRCVTHWPTATWAGPGRAGLINACVAAGDNELQESVRITMINERAGGINLILGRKAFKKIDERGRGAVEYDGGCLSGSAYHHRLIQAGYLPNVRFNKNG